MVAQSTRRGGKTGSKQSSESTMGQVGQMMAHPEELVSDYPFSSALLVFGVGLGVGIVLSQALCESSMWQPESRTERWGRQMYDYLSNMVPESVSRRMPS